MRRFAELLGVISDSRRCQIANSVHDFFKRDVAAVRAKYVGLNPPANTLVQIQQLADPAYKGEIEATAVLP